MWTISSRVLRTLSDPAAVRTTVDPLVPPVLADAELLERALENVIASAYRFSPTGVEVHVQRATSTSEVLLRVRDHGPGVADGERETLFAPFHRFGNSSDCKPGVGLGLAVAKGFVEAMGGRIEPSATPGGGLTMELTLRADGAGR